MDNRSDDDQLGHKMSRDAQNEGPECGDEKDHEEGPSEQLIQDNCLDGLQYDDEELPYEEYSSYAFLLDDKEPIYIRAMSNDEGMTPRIAQFDDVDWKSCHDIIRGCY